MAYIDKIYGTPEQRRELKRFFMRYRKRVWKKRYFYPPNKGHGPITNFPVEVDRWLWGHCDIPWVRERLEEQHPEWGNESWPYPTE